MNMKAHILSTCLLLALCPAVHADALKDMLQQYAEHARKSSGLHYVPSFNGNDLCTQDDLVEQEDEVRGTGGGRNPSATLRRSAARRGAGQHNTGAGVADL